jgi:CBS domain-containing protein
MKVRDIMTARAESCPPDADLGRAALIMWKGDCGIVPVVENERLVGVITDRDICMGLATTGRCPHERTIREVMSKDVLSVTAEADVKEALDRMRKGQVRRLPVIGQDGRLEGIISINDLILEADGARHAAAHVPIPELLRTLKAICAHRNAIAAAVT